MSQNGDMRRDPPPPMPVAITVTNAVTNYVRESGEDGQTLLVFTPLLAAGGEATLIGPQIRVVFDSAGWERFQREVAADGVKSPIAIPEHPRGRA